MTDKIRISRKMYQTFPTNVADAITRIAEDYRIKSFTFKTVAEDYKFYVGEGDSYTGISADGRTAGFETVSAETIGAMGVSHRIGAQFAMPAGSYVIRVSYYTKYWMDVVYKVSGKMIEA